MDLQRIVAKQRRAERDRRGDTNVGYARFCGMMLDMERVGWLVPGHEQLTRTLTVAAITGDDVAAAQLHDLFEQEGVDKWVHEVEDRVAAFRHAYSSWTAQSRATFLRHCREKGVYRTRG